MSKGRDLLERLMESVIKAPTGYRILVINDSGDTDECYLDQEMTDLLDEVSEFLYD